MKQLIDQLYKDKYKELHSYTSKAIKHFGRKYDTELVLSESYIYIIERVKKVEKELTQNEIEGMVKTYIKNSIRWDNSSLNNGKILCVKKFNNINNALQLEDLGNNILSKDTLYDSEFVKIESMVNDYYELLTRIDKRLFHMYYYQDLTNVKSIKKHLNISSTSAYETHKDCKRIYEGLRAYIKKEINI